MFPIHIPLFYYPFNHKILPIDYNLNSMVCYSNSMQLRDPLVPAWESCFLLCLTKNSFMLAGWTASHGIQVFDDQTALDRYGILRAFLT